MKTILQSLFVDEEDSLNSIWGSFDLISSNSEHTKCSLLDREELENL